MTNKQARVVICTGDGKGKTTSALGMVLRAVGHGMKVAVIHFAKADTSVGEFAALSAMEGVEVSLVGLGFVPPADHPKFPEHVAAAESGLQHARDVIASQEHDLIVLDEVCFAVSCGLLEEDAVLEAVSLVKPDARLILTGRGATPGLIERADTVTEMRMIKHGYEIGIPAQDGVEK